MHTLSFVRLPRFHRRTAVLLAAVLVGSLFVSPQASATPTPAGESGSIHVEATFPVVTSEGSDHLGTVTLSADATGATVDSEIRSDALSLPSGHVRLQSCIGAVPAVAGEAAQCADRTIAPRESRQQVAPTVSHRGTRAADADTLVIGFVNVHRRVGPRWELVASSWPATGSPSVVVPGSSTVLWEPSGIEAPVAVDAGVDGGSYDLTAVVSGDGGRAQLTVNGERVGEFAVSGSRELTVPVRLDGPTDSIGVSGSATVTRLRLDAAAPGFTTRGDAILAPDGTPVVPRGVNRTGLNASTTPENMTAADFAAMAAAGADIVRLKLGEQLWVEGHCAYDPAYPAAVDAAVDAITDLGMVALLDLAWTTGLDPCGSPGLKAMPDSTSVTFWQQVAGRYKDNPSVAFGIYNEPHGINRSVWRDGGTLTHGTEPWPVVGMQDLYDTVRATGARNLVYVSGTAWSHNLLAALSHPLDGYGIVYGAHIYNDGAETLPPSVANGVEPVLGTYPVVVTEFGSTTSGTFNQRVIQWADAHGLGWQAFMWAPKSAGAFALFDDWGSYQPARSGWPVLASLAYHRDSASAG